MTTFRLLIDQQPVHPRSTSRRKSFLRLNIWLPPFTAPAFEFLHFSLPQPPEASFRVWRLVVSAYARRSWGGVDRYPWREVQPG